ncbi:MAG: hypothetical protein ACHQ6U_13425 [Thermodesulfobacteriota bacterium]
MIKGSGSQLVHVHLQEALLHFSHYKRGEGVPHLFRAYLDTLEEKRAIENYGPGAEAVRAQGSVDVSRRETDRSDTKERNIQAEGGFDERYPHLDLREQGAVRACELHVRSVHEEGELLSVLPRPEEVWRRDVSEEDARQCVSA